MIKKIILLVIHCCFILTTDAQKVVLNDPSALGILFFTSFFQTNIDKKDASSQGVAINFSKGIAHNYNISTTANGSFVDYPIDRKGQGDNCFLFQADVLIKRKFNLSTMLMPYMGIGITPSLYAKNFGILFPVNAGIQVRLTNQLFFVADVLYRWKLTSNTANHFQLSAGISCPVFQKKEKGAGTRNSYSIADAAPLLKDSDGDGIVDSADACPLLVGVAKYKGCPIPDTDKDGVNDEDDKCPTVAGTRSNGGCPILDRDNDGIVDSLDHCPEIPGDVTNNGCPSLELSGFHSSAIQFVSNSAELVPTAFIELNKLVDFLNKYENVRITVDGHTDNIGSERANQKLSERRAEAVKKYLLSKGIKEVRITTNGFGFSAPITDNNTVEGRQRNRRVEFNISQ